MLWKRATTQHTWACKIRVPERPPPTTQQTSRRCRSHRARVPFTERYVVSPCTNAGQFVKHGSSHCSSICQARSGPVFLLSRTSSEPCARIRRYRDMDDIFYPIIKLRGECGSFGGRSCQGILRKCRPKDVTSAPICFNPWETGATKTPQQKCPERKNAREKTQTKKNTTKRTLSPQGP